jgi:succinyl-CoA synthetase beta subunit
MKLREYQAKGVFREAGIRVPRGEVTDSAEGAGQIAEEFGGPVVLKPQLGVKGRGKVGGIGFADDPAGARAEAERLLALTVKGEAVRTLLVEERADVADELYLAVTIDYAARGPVLIASAAGGVDIEEVARDRPDEVLRLPVDILTGPSAEDLGVVAERLGPDVAEHLATLYRIFRESDAEIVEVNPLVRTGAGDLLAVDAVLNVNEDSVARHPELLELKAAIPADDPIAEEAAEKSWTYIDLGGDIGVLSSGAGLTMAILDLIQYGGGTPGNFLDTAQIDDEGIYEAFELLGRAREFKVLLVNIFAGLNRCDLLADGIRRYLEGHPLQVPVVVRMIGNLEEEGHRILRDAGIEPTAGLEDAVDRAVALSREVTS